MHPPSQGRSKVKVAIFVVSVLIAACLVAVAVMPEPKARNLVRQDLIHSQRDQQVALVGVKNDWIWEVDGTSQVLKRIRELPIRAGSFSSVSSDGKWVAFDACTLADETQTATAGTCVRGLTHLAIIGTDGRHLREFPSLVYPGPSCWSRDDTKLALVAQKRAVNRYALPGLEIVDIASGEAKTAAAEDPIVGPQCWSSDGNQIVYSIRRPRGINILRLYDVIHDRSRDLASGGGGAWEPNGNRIAYEDCTPESSCTYRFLRLDDGNRTASFGHEWGAEPLLWSPDSRFVIRESFRRFSEHPLGQRFELLAPVEQLNRDSRLRVRDLTNNSEDWLVNLSDSDPTSFQWVRAEPFR